MRLLLLFLLFAPLHAAIFWQKGDVKIEIADETLFFEEPLHIDLTIAHPKDFAVDINHLRRNLLRNATPYATPFLLNQEQVISTDNETRIHYTLEAQMPGDFTLSFFDIPTSNGEIFSSLFPIRVDRPAAQAEMPAIEPAPLMTLSRKIPVDINSKNRRMLKKLLEKEPERNLRIQAAKTFPWGLLGTLFFITAVLIWLRFFRRPSKLPEKEALNAREKALNSLEKIRSEQPSSVQEVNALSNTVRYYIEDRYGIHAPQKTTQEFFETTEMPPQFPVEQLHRFLLFSDQVKFARGFPSAVERERTWEAASKLINFD